MIQNTNYGASKTYVNTKVDKLTTSGVKAYTHDGATQGEIDVSNTYTPATLALRDANGRMQAADPASGATDKTLVTANWVSQTGSGAPNNLVHTDGDEVIDGNKYAKLPILAPATSPTNAYYKVAFLGSNTQNIYMCLLVAERYSCGMAYGFYNYTDGTTSANKVMTSNTTNISVGIFVDSDNDLWLVNKRLSSGSNRCSIAALHVQRGTGLYNPVPVTDGSTFTDNDGTYYEVMVI